MMTDVHNQSDVGNQFNASTLNNPVFNYGEKKIAKYLGILPVIPEVFIGRDEKLQEVHDELFDGNNLLLLVNGEGGIGKTTLAAKYYQRYFEEYAHLGWVFAERSLGDALLTLADPLKVEFAPTDAADVRREKLLREMAGLNKPCLLVIDNANDLDDLSAHYHELRKCPIFHILLTTRITEFSHAGICRVGHLDEPLAMRLFTTHYPGHNAAEDELLNELLRAIGYNTLVIELLAKNLRILNEYRTAYALSQLLDDLQHRGLFGLSKSDKVLTEYNPGSFRLREEKPETVIAAMYDLAKLEPGEERLLCVFSVLPAEPITFDTLEALQPGNDELEKFLRSLVKKGWIEFNAGTKQFKCSPVVQAVTRHQVGDRLDDQCETLVRALLEKLDCDPGSGHLLNTDYLSGALYARYAENVAEYLESTPYEKAVLYERIGMFYRTTGQLQKALSFFEKETQLFEALYKAHPENVSFKNVLAISYEKLGDTYTSLGELQKALSFFEKDAALSEELYEAYPDNFSFKNGLAVSYERLGDNYTSSGNLEKALSFFEKYNQLSKELYEAWPDNVSFKNGLAISYALLGVFNRDQRGDMAEARRWFEKAEALRAELVNDAPSYAEFQKNWAQVKKDLAAL